MHGIAIYDATDADAELVARDIRFKDKLEMLQWAANEPRFAVAHSVRHSDVAFACYAEDGAIMGVCGAKRDNLIERTAVIWSLTTNAVNTHKIAFVKASKAMLERIMKAMPDVEEFHNWVTNDYPEAQSWIEWLGAGFSMHGNRRGYGDSTFREFYIINPYYKED